MTRAIIDLGTNSALLLIANRTTILRDEARITALGEELASTSLLSEAARKRTLEALKEFKAICNELRVDDVILVGTEACRRAQNTDVFRKEIERETGFTLRILSGEEEAQFSYRAAISGFPPSATPSSPLVVDPGGGSTEFIYQRTDGRLHLISIPIGSVVLTEMFLKHDPPLELELQALADSIDGELKKNLSGFPKDKPLVILAGTATSLAAIDLKLDSYDGGRVHGHPLSLFAIQAINTILSTSPLLKRQKIPGLHPKRAKAIVAGGMLVERILHFFEKNSFQVSDRGVRYGVLLQSTACKI